ncbi:linear amide C-N hydrolase [Martelella alba]|uniref:Linear amide C-N hydrolase n=1 Tax=Martelella alba TaxID=2590451 RepID=A0A506U223_9HYPH|nr:linear amide C-N hydrolase [Martelella alba]TPW27084.1 linear amide C-N hydrolase [Martelella alba]
MCTRIFYETGNATYITGRNMDWSDVHMQTDFWVFPRGLKRDGGLGDGSAEWTSRYGSAIVSIYNLATSDGLNEAGLAGNMLYLAESDFGDPAARGKPLISAGAWLQYMLDNFATVEEAVAAMADDPLTVVSADAPNGKPATVHLALSDASGDSAILEFVGGRLTIHHGRDFKVMTNSPVYDQQLAINSYWDLVGGKNFLPGTIAAADRFARASYNLKSTPQFADQRAALASVFSQMRAVSTPLGMADPEKPNIASTLWRTVIDHEARRYFFDSVINPSVFWIALGDFNLEAGAPALKLDLGDPATPGGDVAGLFQAHEPFSFLIP